MDYSLFAKYFRSTDQKIINLVPHIHPIFFRSAPDLDPIRKKWLKDEVLLANEPETYIILSNKAPPLFPNARQKIKIIKF